MITIPAFEDKAGLFDWLIQNKALLIDQKKSTIKHADAVHYGVRYIDDRGEEAAKRVMFNNKWQVIKADTVTVEASIIKVRSIVNTTKLMDTHDDVHIDQLWNKSIKETKFNYLVQEHDFSFAGVISDDVKAFAKQFTWKELGFDYAGQTQALVYDSTIIKEQSPFMFDKYALGKVKQHSVGMRYIKVEMAVNDERYEKEKATWDRYYPIIANKEVPDAKGYFWAVLEAKNIEGSAVLAGSNWATPTLNVEQIKEPLKNTRKNNEPVKPLKKLNELLKTKKIY